MPLPGIASGAVGIGAGIVDGLGKIAGIAAGPIGGLADAFAKGLGSLGIPGLGGGSSGPTNVTQSQNVSQATDVTVTNVLGGRAFGGGVDEAGNFDVFQTISDVFAIKAAQDAQAAGSVSEGSISTPQIPVTAKKPFNWTTILLIGGAGLGAYLLLNKNKK